MKFTQIPVPLKIIKLLVRELDQTQQAGTRQSQDDDDEWADEVAVTDEGDFIDFRNFNLIFDWIKSKGQESLKWYGQLTDQERSILLRASKKY